MTILASLLAIPREGRDDAWRHAFYAEVADAPVVPAEPPVARGPDGLPYLVVERAEPHASAGTAPLRDHVRRATEEGLGLVLDPAADEAAWVFSYGSLLWFRMSGYFELPELEAESPAAPGQDGERVLIGAPSEAFLPGYARAVLRKVLVALGIEEPGVFLIHRPGEAVPSLVLSLFPDQFEGPERLGEVLSALTWYLPHHYRLVALQRTAELEAHFVPL
jgi:hypothetical protein